MTTDDWDEITKPYSYPPPFLQEQLPTQRDLGAPEAPKTVPSPPPDFFTEDEEPECSIFSNYCLSE